MHIHLSLYKYLRKTKQNKKRNLSFDIKQKTKVDSSFFFSLSLSPYCSFLHVRCQSFVHFLSFLYQTFLFLLHFSCCMSFYFLFKTINKKKTSPHFFVSLFKKYIGVLLFGVSFLFFPICLDEHDESSSSVNRHSSLDGSYCFE